MVDVSPGTPARFDLQALEPLAASSFEDVLISMPAPSEVFLDGAAGGEVVLELESPSEVLLDA